MTKKILKGDELMLFKDGQSIALATSHSLTLTGDAIDENTKDFGLFGSKEINKITWEVTAEHLYSEYDYDALFDLMIAKTKFNVVFGQTNYDKNGLGERAYWENNTNKTYYSGIVFISSLTANANTGENSSFSMTLTGVGAITKNEIVSNISNPILMNAIYRSGASADTTRFTKEEANAVNANRLNVIANLLGNQVVSFDEFQYFTSITELPEGIFDSSKITSIVFPSSITNLYRRVFAYNTALTNVVLNDGLHVIRELAFRQCTGLTNVAIPSSVTHIKSYAFSGIPNLTITFEGSNPPQFTDGTPFDNVNTVTVRVPSGSLSAYRTALTNAFNSELQFTITGI